MIGHPKDDAQWATNPTFVSPGDSWDTDPTKVAPPAGLKDEGWEPTLVHPAEIDNYLRNKVGEFIEYLRLVVVKNWRFISAGASDLFAIGYDASTGVYVVSGSSGTASTVRSLNGGASWISPTGAPALNNYSAVASDGAGNWVLAGVFADCYESSDNGDTWTLRTIGASAIRDVVFEPSSALWVAVGVLAGDAKIYTSPDRVTWTLRHTFVSEDFVRIAIDGSGRAVAIGAGGVFSKSGDMLVWSPDTTFTADTFADIEYSSGAGLWMITGNDASLTTPFVATSTDGVTFAQIGPGGLPAVFSFGNIGVDGGNLWLATAVGVNRQLFVSTDAGINWTEITGVSGIRFLDATDSGGTITRMEFFARKFWLVGDAGDVLDSLAL